MAEHLLDEADIGTVIQHQTGRSVAEQVTAAVLFTPTWVPVQLYKSLRQSGIAGGTRLREVRFVKMPTQHFTLYGFR